MLVVTLLIIKIQFQNLKRLERAGIPSPKAAFVKKAVLVMEFLGKDGKSAWKLRDYPFTNEATIKLAYEQVIRVSCSRINELCYVHITYMFVCLN